jgi:hypothetical protein
MQQAGNPSEESFTITVQDTTDPDVVTTRAVDRSGRDNIWWWREQ